MFPGGELGVDPMRPGGEAFQKIAVSLDDGLESSFEA
jgi:hypothetical protein